ncbi:MAG: hypothetical protein WBF73_07755 [Bradyrhizobium sp.]
MSTALSRSFAQGPSRQMIVAIQAVDEHKIAYGPRDRCDRMLRHVARVVQKSDVRDKVRFRHAPQATSGNRCAKSPPKRLQPDQPIFSRQDERATGGIASKADGAVERNLEWRDPNCLGSVTRHSNDVIRQPTKKE